MIKRRHSLLALATAVTLTAVMAGSALAQNLSISRSPSMNVGVNRSPGPGPGGLGGRGGGFRGGGSLNGGWHDSPGLIENHSGDNADDKAGDKKSSKKESSRRTNRRAARRTTNTDAADTVPDQVMTELSTAITQPQIDALRRRHRLEQIESQTFDLSGSRMILWRILGGRPVATVQRQLAAERFVISTQGNHLFKTEQSDKKTANEGALPQYELAKLRLPEAHALAKGDGVLVAVIDSGVDVDHPELAGAIAGTYDTLPAPFTPHKHGTAIAGLIAAHGKLLGSAPQARILAVRTFNPAGHTAQGTTFNILKALDWSAANNARIINMSFAGPADAAIHRALAAALKRGIVLIAAAGNAGPKSPPLYPAAETEVIAVTATDVHNKLLAQAVRGDHIAVAAPGAEILVAIPDGGYEVSSGTSYSAAEVSGIVALMLERKPDLTPERVREILTTTAKDLGPKGRDRLFGAGLVDAYDSLLAEALPTAAALPLPVNRPRAR
jgi:subtilisin family serine protease